MKFQIVYIFSLFLFITFKQSIARVKDSINVVAGTSKLTGQVSNKNNLSKNNVLININIPNHITGEFDKHEVTVDQSGKFSIEVNVELNISLIVLNTNINPEKSLIIKLINDGVTHVDIVYDANNEIESISATPDMNLNDITKGLDIFYEMAFNAPPKKPVPLYDKSTDYFKNYANGILSERLEILKNDRLISNEFKSILSKELNLFFFKEYVFPYQEVMIRNFRNTNDDKSKEPEIQKIDKKYFRFLKDFNLNDQQYLQTFSFLEFQKEILQNETLGIPKIEENDIPSWLASVKIILADLIGFENGPYYDVLVANAFGRQLNEEVRPLSKKQITHIIDYWGDGDFAKILFRKNKEVIELNKVKSPAIVKDVSTVPDDQVIETILAAHQNKVILIDLWATWCGPCLNAMERFKNIKGTYYDKEVVFVYLTNSSSPLKLWEEKIIGIGNEHYYLTDNQWKYVMKQFEFEGIPSYLLFNKKGELVNKFTAFPSNEAVKEMINAEL